jgi:hypothetical protein
MYAHISTNIYDDSLNDWDDCGECDKTVATGTLVGYRMQIAWWTVGGLFLPVHYRVLLPARFLLESMKRDRMRKLPHELLSYSHPQHSPKPQNA